MAPHNREVVHARIVVRAEHLDQDRVLSIGEELGDDHVAGFHGRARRQGKRASSEPHPARRHEVRAAAVPFDVTQVAFAPWRARARVAAARGAFALDRARIRCAPRSGHQTFFFL